MVNVKPYAWATAIGLAIILYCHYRLSLSWGICVSILLGLWVVYHLDEDHNELRKLVTGSKAAKRLRPYQVVIVPQWHQLLLDYKLINRTEEFSQLWEKGLKDAPVIRFTVLQSDDLGLPQLIYWDTRKSFVTSVDFEEPVKGLEFEKLEGARQPEFMAGLWEATIGEPRWVRWFLKSGVGYELGLTVPTGWWDRIRAVGEMGDIARTEFDTNALTGETQLMVATLPCQEFEMYSHRGERDLKPLNKQEEGRSIKLAEHGWKRKDTRDAEVRSPWHYLEQKYFHVQHRSI